MRLTSPVCSLSVKGPAGAHVDLRAVWQSGLCLHFQKIQEVLLYSVCQTVRSDKEDRTVCKTLLHGETAQLCLLEVWLIFFFFFFLVYFVTL